MEPAACGEWDTREKLKEAKQYVPVTIVMQKKALRYEDAQKLLMKNNNRVIEALK